jgi:flagellar biosynthesis/type III secretory pathway M-ring protein FliF/YscJ
MDSIQRALQNIGRMWAALHATQRVILSASAVLMVVLLVWGSAASAPSWVRVAGPEVTADARANILRKFQEKNQKHEVRGAEIYVPKEDADRVVLELSGEGSMSNNAVWKFLEQSDIFATHWEKEKRMQIALQARLEGMIRSVESVKNASVIINPGSTSSQLGFAGAKASASVQIELHEGKSLNRKNVQAIAGLVARAVNGVEENQVHIMDTKGNSYRALKADEGAMIADTFREYERSIEQDIQKQLKETFAFTGASVIVRVKANNISTNSEEDKFGRGQTKESEESTVRKGGVSQALPQVRKGSGESEAAPEAPAPPPELQSSNRESKVFDRKKTVEHNPGGEIQRITVGVLIPVEVGPEGKELAEAEKKLPMLKEFVRIAAMPANSEDVSVQMIPTKRPEALIAPLAPETLVEWMSRHATKVGLFGLALAALFVLLRVVQTAMARDTVEEIQSLTDALTEGQEAATELAGAAPAGVDLGRLKQNVQDMVGRNPQSVAASLKSFMSGK